MASTFDHVDDVGVSINYAHLAGHNTIRASVMGGVARAARAEELAAMEEMLSAGMAQGAFGLSTGLVYAPACFADKEELTALCRVSARQGGFWPPTCAARETRFSRRWTR